MFLPGRLIALDTETTLIRDGEIPTLVLASATDGQRGVFIAREHLPLFLEAHREAQWLFHNAAFDLPVLQQGGCDLHPRVDAGRVYDTGLLYRLLRLAEAGSCHGAWSLDHVARELLGIELLKELKSSDGLDVRTSYGRFLRPDGRVDYADLLRPEHRPYLTYAGSDPVTTFLVAEALNERARTLFQCRALDLFDRDSYEHAGAHDGISLGPSWRAFGFLTHDIQLKGALALASVERNGMALDAERVHEAVSELDRQLAACLQRLKAEFDWAPGTGSQVRLEAILARVERELGALPRTEQGRYSRSAEDLEEFATRSPFIHMYLRHQELNKIRNTFMEPLHRADARVRGKFNVLVNTGRTSCSGKRSEDGARAGLNLQNLPREDSVRECFKASPGHVLFACDYSTIELVTLAQHCLRKFGWSRMAEAIRKNADLHCVYAARRQGIPIDHLPSWDKKALLPLLGPDGDKLRNHAKPVNFGFPGGLGAETFVQFARSTYQVEMSVEQAREEKTRWLEAWPEVSLHLASDDLMRLAHLASDLWETHPNVWSAFRADELPWTVHIFRGVMQGQTVTATKQRPYTPEELDWAWGVAAQMLQRMGHLSTEQRAVWDTRVRERIAGRDLWSALTPRQRFVSTLTGRLRGYPTYCAARNCVFQGLAADGAKLALYRLYREGFRIVNFIHDEILLEFPEAADHTAMAAQVERIMVEEMRRVVPDLPVTCEYAMMGVWSKRAKAVFVDGKLAPWVPDAERVPA